MGKTASGYNTFNMHIDKDLLVFLKHQAIQKDCTMTTLVTKCLSDYKKRIERKEKNTEKNSND